MRWWPLIGLLGLLHLSCTRLVAGGRADTHTADMQSSDLQLADLVEGPSGQTRDYYLADGTGDHVTDLMGDQVAESIPDQSFRDHTTRSLALATDWVKTIGNGSSDMVRAVAIDDAGNVTVGGTFVTSITLGGKTLNAVGYNDGFIARFDITGKHLWSHSIGGDSNNEVSAIVDTGAAIVVGAYCKRSCQVANLTLPAAGSAVAIARFDTDGNVVWAQRAGGPGTGWVRSVLFDGSAITVAGTFTGTLDFGGNPLAATTYTADGFIAQLDGAGGHRWSTRFGADGTDAAESISRDGQGGFVVGGHFERTIDLGGGPLVSHGSSDILVARFDGDGTHLWSHGYGGSGHDVGSAIAMDNKSTIYLTGSFARTLSLGGPPIANASGEADVFLASYDDQGRHLWSQGFGGTATDRAEAISCSTDGVVSIVGTTWGDLDLGGGPLSITRGIFIARYAFDGSHRWSRGYQGRIEASSIAENASHRIVIGGEIWDSADFGTGQQTSKGTQDGLAIVMSAP